MGQLLSRLRIVAPQIVVASTSRPGGPDAAPGTEDGSAARAGGDEEKSTPSIDYIK